MAWELDCGAPVRRGIGDARMSPCPSANLQLSRFNTPEMYQSQHITEEEYFKLHYLISIYSDAIDSYLIRKLDKMLWSLPTQPDPFLRLLDVKTPG